MYKKNTRIHFVGIGGIGMSGIAKILCLQGYTVSGCDINQNKNTKELLDLGCTVSKIHNSKACKEVDILVYSTAVKEHAEVTSAKQNKIIVVHRAQMLAEILRKNFNIAVTGSHGKTTTTSLISHILIESDLDPTVISGGVLKHQGTHAVLGKSNISVAEADESDKSLLHLKPTLGIVTNISLEHLETYKDLEDIKKTFKLFLENISFYGKAVVCVDDKNIQALVNTTNVKTIKYGLSKEANVTAKNIKLYPECSRYELWVDNKKFADIELEIAGQHNILNSLAAIATALELEVPIEKIVSAVKSFCGVERRFELHGTFNGAQVFDDYAHHPNEIKQTLEVASKRTKGKIFVVFQPHRYSRTQALWQEFIDSFVNSKIHSLVITDIFSASEAPLKGITGQSLADSIKKKAQNTHVKYLPIDEEFSSIIEHLKLEASSGDLVLFMGAGKLNKAAEIFVKDYKSLSANKANNQPNA